MVAKIGLTTDTIRSVAGIAVPSKKDDSSFIKTVSVLISGAVSATSLFFVSSLGLRLNLTHRLMTDKPFSESFMDGAFKEMNNTHAAAYIKATDAPENFRDIWPNTKNHFKLSFGLAKELKEKGLTWKQAWKGMTSLEKLGKIAWPAAALGIFAETIYMCFQKSGLKKGTYIDEQNTVIISTPQHLADQIIPLMDQLKEKSIPVEINIQTASGSPYPHTSGRIKTDSFAERVAVAEPRFIGEGAKK